PGTHPKDGESEQSEDKPGTHPKDGESEQSERRRDGALPAVASEKPSCPGLLSCYLRRTIPNLTKNQP
ncbi:MAG: hypothetical protein B5M55_02520, partial [Desulfococcus sp. 4484_242]